MIKDSTTTGPPSTSGRSTWFLGCFGCSGKELKHTDEVNSGSRLRRWISSWSFRRKKSDGKTVPVDHSIVPRESKLVNHSPVSSDTTWEIQVVEEDPTLTKKHKIMVEGKNSPVKSNEQKINRKKWTDSVKLQNGSYRSRRKEMKTADVTASGAGSRSPEKKKTVTLTHALVASPLKPLTHSKSLPPPKRIKPPRVSPAGDGGDGGVTPPSGREFDSIIGMSVILVTLLIMVLWGRLCAILCTSAWFFIVPRLGAAGKRPPAASAEKRRPESSVNMDLESVEYKKKVVLEGLLQRNHRNVAGRP